MKVTRIFFTLCALFASSLLPGQAAPTLNPAPDVTVPIPAPPPPPGAPAEIWSGTDFKNVSTPELYVYLNQDRTKTHPAIIICPGGAYTHIAYEHCVNDWLPFWHSQGFVVLGLKYRLIATGIPALRADAVTGVGAALLLVHQHASEWHINPDQIGLWGASAGSNAILNYLCQPLGTDKAGLLLPRFAVVLSPWPGRQAVKDFAFSPGVPPLFFASARDDKTAPEVFARALAANATQNSVDFYYVVDKGGHQAFSSFTSKYPEDDWKPSFLSWLQKACGIGK